MSGESKNSNTNNSSSGASSVGSGNNNTSTKSSKLGRKGDPRMHRAVAARLANPALSLFEALRLGGFDYPTNDDASVVDSEKVTLGQRKNQLSRRLRLARKQDAEKNGEDTGLNEKSNEGLDAQQELQNMMRQQRQRTSKTSNIGALALKMKRDCPELGVLSDDEDMETEEPKRQRVAKFHPDYAPLFVPPSASALNPFHTGNASMPAQNGMPQSVSHQAAAAFPSNQGAGNFAGINMNSPPFGQTLGAASNFPQNSLFSQQMGNVFNPHQAQPPRASGVAISSLTASAQAVGMTLEQLAMTLSSNPPNLSKIILGMNDTAAVEKQEELALHLYEMECKALYGKCMLMAGMDPKLCQPNSQAHLEFALKAWQAQGRRLQELVRNTPTVRDPPLETENEKSPAVGRANSDSGSSQASLHHNHSYGHSHGGDKQETRAYSHMDGRHVHRLNGQCGHKAIIHHPKDGVAHIDFVIGQVVECYHGIEPVGKKSIWPSKYRCKELENCSHKCDASHGNISDALRKIQAGRPQPKTIPLSEINLHDPEWNFDVNGSIDGGVTGLFKLGEMSDDISTI
jgi:hypothetical protein